MNLQGGVSICFYETNVPISNALFAEKEVFGYGLMVVDASDGFCEHVGNGENLDFVALLF